MAPSAGSGRMRASSLSVNNVDDFESEYEREHSVSVELVAFKKKDNFSEKNDHIPTQAQVELQQKSEFKRPTAVAIICIQQNCIFILLNVPNM